MEKNPNQFVDNEAGKLNQDESKKSVKGEPQELQYASIRTQLEISQSKALHPNPNSEETESPPAPKATAEPENLKLKLKQPETLVKSVTFFGLFRFATGGDVAMMILAALFSSIMGAILPLMTLFFADFADNLSDSVDVLTSRTQITKIAFKMAYLGVAVFGASFLAIVLWSATAIRQTKAFRSQYFLHLLLKRAAWFDKEKAGKLANAYFEHNSAMMQTYSTKLHMFFQIIATVVAGFAVGFYKGWLVSLLIIAASPLMVVGLSMFLMYMGRFIKVQIKAYASAGAISDQAFEYVRGVKSLNGESHELAKYEAALQSGFVSEQKEGWKGAFFYAMFNVSWSFVYALSFLIGNYALGREWHNHNSGKTYTVGDFLAIFFGIITGMSSISMIAPINQSLSQGQAAMGRINQIVNLENRESSGKVKTPARELRGEIEFQNVTFAYPSAPERPVLKDVSFTIRPGKKFAIVGPSGSGKSTIIQLIERFYDPQEGSILLDGTDIKQFDLAHYRKLLGLVSQQPILFADTIRANMLIGLDNSAQVSESQILDALERANVKDFITTKLEKGLETYVGTSGAQLSGGQKQRISIARVLLRGPKLFLFDEATSALDRQNEKEIQETIDRVCSEVTSVSIAHRLLTIRNSDQIVVLVDGQIKETGRHQQLMQIENGIYQDLCTKQGSGEEEDKEGLDSGLGIKNELSNDLLGQNGLQLENGKHVSGDHPKTSQPSKNPDLTPDSKDGKAKGKSKKPPVFMSIYYFLTGKDICYIIIAVISSGFLGAIMPFIGIYLLTNTLNIYIIILIESSYY